jgi:serine phosphatase RsbU (regulator of sigma subunit)
MTRFLGLFLIAPLLTLATIPVAVHITQKPDFGFAVHQLEVRSLDPDGPASAEGLLAGDRILKVNGTPIPKMTHWFAALAGHYDLAPVLLTVQRQGQEYTLLITPDEPNQMRMIHDFSLWVSGLAFLMIGWLVFFRREDLVARNFFALCAMFAFMLLDIPDLPQVGYMVAKENLRALVQLMQPAYFLRFFLQFPSPRFQSGGSLRRWRSLLWPGWSIFLIMVLLELPFATHLAEVVSPWIDLVALVYYLGFFLAGLVVFTKRILRRDRPIQHTKMLVILVGLLAGLLPFLASMIMANLNPAPTVPQWQYLAFSLVLVPISFGLAIMRYGALDKSFILRISLIYGALTLVVLVVYFLIVMALGEILASLFSISTYPVLLLVVAASSLAILPLRRLVQNWIDNAFYPGRRANRRAISLLGKDLTSLIEADDVIQNLLKGLNELFRPTDLVLFINSESESAQFTPHRQRLEHQDLDTPDCLPQDSSLSILLNRLRRPVFAEELEDLLFTGDTDPDSLGLLTQLKANLLVPLISGNRLLGFWAFGPKGSGALYTQEDLSHLNNLAVQAGSLLESRQLYHESLQQKITETELELARTIQHSLLPSEALEDNCFVIAGLNESCRMVGGDYFDYFLRSDGSLGFALADVSGKGIPAALHMTSLRVAFRQEADAEDLPHKVIKRLNSTVNNFVSSGQFICFFYGIWHPETGILNYCNAGCEPPVLLNPDREFHQYLRKGGPILGITEEQDYRQGSILLNPRDRLFLFTDGLTDQQNQDDQFFDLPRLLALLESNLESTPVHLLDKIFASINSFGGADRTDDKTAILLEVKNLRR